MRSLCYDGTGRHPAPHCAEYASTAGGRVTLVSIDGELAVELSYAERVIWKRRCYQLGIDMSFDNRLKNIVRSGNRLIATFINETTGALTERTADQIVVERGTVPLDSLYHDLRTRATNNGVTDLDALLTNKPQSLTPGSGFELHRIGDAVASRNIHAAVYDALRLCQVM